MFTNQTSIEIMEGANLSLVNEFTVKVSGKNGELERTFGAGVKLEAEGKTLKISTKRKEMLNTVKAHILNMMKGVNEGFSRKMKVCFAHFPMNVKVQGNQLLISNFQGEKSPRKVRISPNVKVEVKGQDVTVSGPDKEAVGETVSRIRSGTKIKKKDGRIFQDGIYPIEG